MNTKIDTFAEQAGWLHEKNFASWNKNSQWQNFDKEKFAELILIEVFSTIYRSDISERSKDILESELVAKFGLDK